MDFSIRSRRGTSAYSALKSSWKLIGQWWRELSRAPTFFQGVLSYGSGVQAQSDNYILQAVRAVSRALPLSLVGAALLSFGSGAQAFVEKNVACNRTSSSTTSMGTFSPGERVELSMSMNCKMLRGFPQGAGISYVAFYAGDNANSGLVFYQPGTNFLIPYGGQGTYSTTCARGQCTILPAGQQFDVLVRASGALRQQPGSYAILVNLFLTSLANTNYSEAVMGFLYTYNIMAPTCNLMSPTSVNLNFGTLSSDQVSSASQVADVSLSCESATKAEVTLVPTLTAVSAQTGVSTTTLKGLEMASTWDDTKTPVTFGAPRALTLGTGSNSLKLRFQPRLSDSSAAPSGNFTSQYTLTITYQ